MKLTCLFTALLLIGFNEAKFRYVGYHLLQVFPSSPDHSKMIEHFEDSDNSVIRDFFWPSKSAIVLIFLF